MHLGISAPSWWVLVHITETSYPGMALLRCCLVLSAWFSAAPRPQKIARSDPKDSVSSPASEDLGVAVIPI